MIGFRRIVSVLLCASIPFQAVGSEVVCSSVFLTEKDFQKIYNSQIRQTLEQHYSLSSQQSFVTRALLWRAQRNLQIQKISNESNFSENLQKADRLLKIAQQISVGAPILERRESQEAQWFQLQVLNESLLKTVSDYRNTATKKNSTLVASVKKIFSSRVIQFALSPGTLPHVTDRPVPPELVQKILVDGMIVHERELAEYYRSTGQNSVAAYRRFSTFYSVIFAVALVYVLIENQKHTKEIINHASVDKIDDSLSGLDATFKALDEEFEARGLYSK